jgi:ABC-type Fe3+-siderophore transport system permease subunit
VGAAAGAARATLAIIFLPGQALFGVNLVAVAAFVGAALAVAGAYVLGRSGGGLRSVSSLILAGVAIASFLTAIQTYAQQRNADQIRQVYAWLLGRLQTAGWQGVSLVLPYVAICAIVVVAHRRVLDILQFGDDEAASLGVRTRRVRFWVVVAATLGTAAVVSVCGAIAFVGIIVPHTVRLMVGRSYRVVVRYPWRSGRRSSSSPTVGPRGGGTGRAPDRRDHRADRRAVLRRRARSTRTTTRSGSSTSRSATETPRSCATSRSWSRPVGGRR